ncbi:MAG: protein BatD, partial [Verrucomicrobia bacterium]|nr:protein BatD [Verrucomicrobiota bacterium]
AIDGLPSRRVSNDFQVVQPKAKRTPAEGKLFDVTLAEDVVLVPTKAGTYTLGPVTFAYFEPQGGTYKTITAPAQTVTISAAPVPQFNVMPQPAATPAPPDPGPAATPPPPATRKSPTPPVPPAGIPRDPLPGSATAPVPMSARSLGWFLLAPCASLGAFWIFLALRRAAQTDPLRRQREARDRLAKTLAAWPTASDSGRVSLLLAWQHDSATLWQVAHAAPPAQAIQQAGSLSTRSTNPRLAAAAAANASDWAALWNEADRALYGAKASLPSDWLPRAEAALAAKRVPGFQPFRLFLPRNLLPFAALLAIGFVSGTACLPAADQPAGGSGGTDSAGAAAYRKGDFPAAEKVWRIALEQAPTDWIARHNLSLALAQQERGGEAAAHAAAAFVQHPTDPAVRWHFANIAEKAGTVPAPLAGFVNPGPRHALAQLASPAGWQVVLIAAAWGVAAALGTLLARSYGHARRLPAAVPIAVLVASVLVAAGAGTGLLTYGLAAQSGAVITTRVTTLHSIPTEADTAQKKTPLAAGSLAAVDKTFLGWRRLAFDHGQTGWVRQDDLVPLWK